MASSGHLILTVVLLYTILIGQITNATLQTQPMIRLRPPMNQHVTDGGRKASFDDGLYCDSWRLAVETNNAGRWSTIPCNCRSFVQNYMTGGRYLFDSEVIADYSLAFANTVEIAGYGTDVWVFDIDETLLSNLPYYEQHGYGSEAFNEKTFDEWVDLAKAPAIPASLKLYKELKRLGFTVFLLTGRAEYQRNVTEKNLLEAGYQNWERLILRGASDHGKSAVVYKSEKRVELVNEGYKIHGSSGDQWSDLLGFALSQRSFKLPNPMYYIA